MQLTEVPNAVRNLGEQVQRSEPVNCCYTFFCKKNAGAKRRHSM